ncbi:MAG: HAD hydrolase-like protein [Phycisphaerae bacterium]|jgi:phosphoglycolate phosphatase-like HAD superfamily hydrolase
MPDHIAALKALKKQHDFFVGIDSDGCAFDTMEIKHKECFIPNAINYFELQAVSAMARETWEFVNLYSEWRGINRFPALVMSIDLLAERPEAIERGFTPPDLTSLREWIKRETALGNPALEAEVRKTGDAGLKRVLEWSRGVNADVAKIVRNVPPFPHLRECLEKLQAAADIMCVSATPCEALTREWEEHDIAGYAMVIAGQEMGSKKEHLQHAAAGKYAPDHILMIGDALGDMKAAKANGALFYPISPGRESDSWKRLLEEGIDRFLAGGYRGAYEDALIAEFRTYLPSVPPWKKAK